MPLSLQTTNDRDCRNLRACSVGFNWAYRTNGLRKFAAQVSRMGVAVAAVVHQPSYEIFAMFDDLLLLCEGGRTAFYGHVSNVQVLSQGNLNPFHGSLWKTMPLSIKSQDAFLRAASTKDTAPLAFT